jgi:SAM-dependent methyltransferase
MQSQVLAEHYDFDQYVTKKRWTSYWHQVDEVLKLSTDSVLEVGVGVGIFKEIARNFGINVETVDIDADLKPDYIASVLELPFKDNAYDVIVAFQILEHLPYEQFTKALSEIKRVATRYVILSLPDAERIWRYCFCFPLLDEKNFYIKRPRIFPKKHKFDGEHYWEISKKGYPLSRITKEFEDQGLDLIKTYRVPENTYHRFFVLRCS